MSEQIAPDTASDQTLSAMIKVFARQAALLDEMFYRAAKEAASDEGPSSCRDIRKALKAQARCRTTFNVLLALHAAAADAEKISNSNEGSIQRGNSPT